MLIRIVNFTNTYCSISILASYSFFELQETFYSLLDEYKCISIKNMSLQKQEILTHDHNKTKKELEKTSNEKTLFF